MAGDCPLAEKYHSVSPYVFSLNNPVRYIDPNGMDVWEMSYKGRLKWIEESDDHVLHALNKKGIRTGETLTLGNGDVFEALASTGKDSDGKVSYANGEASDLPSVFLFASDNTNVEWRFSRYDKGDGNRYALGTIHDGNVAISTDIMGFSLKEEKAFIHSHPDVSLAREISSMGWRINPNNKNEVNLTGDSQSVHDYTEYTRNYFTYFPGSKNIYQVKGASKPVFIKNIKDHNYKSNVLFWGVLNGK